MDEADAVQQLGPGDTGRWLVTSASGTQHVWDLDAGTYQRVPMAGRASFPWDVQVVALTRVERWPAVGGKSLIWFDDPSQPGMLEHWRMSNVIARIERLPEYETTPPGDEGLDDAS